jgi:predicted  nucleic acid-binding Zn-ribbon protein
VEPRVVVDILVELGSREHELSEFAARADRGRKEARDRQELLAELDEDARLAAGEVDEAEAAFRRRDRELRELEAKLAERRDRLVGLADRRQHRAVSEEIAALEARIDQLETEAIGDLEEAAARRRTAGRAGGVRDDLAARDLARHDDLAAEVDRAEAGLQEIRAEIARLVGLLPPDVGRHAARLQKRDGHAVAWIDKGACTGCGMLLPPQEAAAAERGRAVVRCPACVRFVVRRRWQ